MWMHEASTSASLLSPAVLICPAASPLLRVGLALDQVDGTHDMLQTTGENILPQHSSIVAAIPQPLALTIPVIIKINSESRIP